MSTPDHRDSKITTRHLGLAACIYIRQSTMKQVQTNRESQVNQYALVQRAQALGWSPARIHVFDGDLGQSAQSSAGRNDFQELVAQVSLGKVGLILGYAVSRLARNNGDWYHLLDLAAVFGTLIADSDGVYDPRLYNDRLLLGLKGTMSEAELHLLRLRLDAGRLSQVRRGDYVQKLPTGLLRRPDGQVVKDPDDQVRHTLELVFAKFQELRSGARVLRYLSREHILLPRRQTGGLHAGELLWKRPTLSALYEILKNPAYAGAFVYGRRPRDLTRAQPGRRATGVVRKPMAEWIEVKQGVYPAYISWEQFLANQAQLTENTVRYNRTSGPARGAPREGEALLQGLATCGHCGHRMRIQYRRGIRYLCNGLNQEYADPMCCSVDGASVHAVVIQAFFEAIQPSQIDALEAVSAKQQANQSTLDRHWQERVKRAEYEAHLAHRQYAAVDPDNRLVAAELERRWEEQLQQLRTVHEDYQRFQHSPSSPPLTPELRGQLQHISDTLPELWQGTRLTAIQRKQLLRSLIARVILKRAAPDMVEVKIVWVSGHFSADSVWSPVVREQDMTRYEEMVRRTRELWAQGLTDSEIAARLTEEGFHSARAVEVTALLVRNIRLQHRWFQPLHQSRRATEFQGNLTAAGLAKLLDVDRSWVYRKLEHGGIEAQHVKRDPVNGVYLIANDEQLIERLRQAVHRRPHTNGGI
jgi:DNA invertase Pin-like site-specific DNA recombinase